jgi:hypothetical protein
MQQTAFPPPLGLQQFGQQNPWAYPGQQQSYGPQYQQFVQPVLNQLLPIAYQAILPQVVAVAAQQINQQLQQLVTAQLSQQPFGGSGGQQPFGPMGRPYQWGF